MDEWMRKVGSYPKDAMQGYAEGMPFPATKDQIIAHARSRRLPKEVMDKLEKIPAKTYNNIGELVSTATRE